MTTRVVELLDLPETVSKGDFVQSLAHSLQEPERTVELYAVTPELANNFRQALKSVAKAVTSGRSQPVFLHGSFGSGKSHFMAVLHLILQGHPAPWRKPALHPVRDAYDPLADKHLLQLHFHMLGARSIEAQVFSGYLAHVRDHHPDAPLPGLFRDQALFDNAQELRGSLGDEAFFAALNKEKAGVSGFGSLGGADEWTADRFDATLLSAEAAPRRDLLTDLVNTLFSSFARQTDRFVDIDEGLAEMSRHAASLGYDGIVLYLDELILWLASQSADLPFVQREINKLVKLKEAQNESRDIPIVSFIARQRDLSKLLGEGVTGAERALIEETLGHHRSRFDTIELSDSNLRAIIPHRVVKAKDADARERLKDGFADLWRGATSARPALQAGDASQADFEQVYPFSPALIDGLIALSDRLQRDRTAIRILVEMLVEHLDDLDLGEVVAVGDVFDLVASADDAVDGPSRAAFERARDVYLHELLPLIRQIRNTDSAEICQRMRPEHPVRIGCSNCPVSDCRNDNRLVKTLLLAALVPRAKPFDGLTVKRLVHLNHGAVKAPVETMKVNLAATKLRELGRTVHALRVSDEDDPTVSVSLQSVDLKPILERANDQDSRARRTFVLRKLLWEQLLLTTQDTVVSHQVEFHHTRRTGKVRFGNVRTLRDDDLKCPDNAEWQVIIDYPFDVEGYTPHDDERRLDKARGEMAGAWTLVWLPTFFSQQVQDDLGDLARLEHILDPANLEGFLSQVPPDEHPRARIDLQSLQGAKRREVITALNKAYGLGGRPHPEDPHLDLNRDVTQHVQGLDDRLAVNTPRAAGMAEGLNRLAEQILDARYPHHPRFQVVPSPMRLARVREFLERLADRDGGMEQAGSQERDDLQRLAEPLRLCRVVGQQVEWLDEVHDKIERERLQAGADEPTLGQVRRWIDPDGLQGLPETAANLVAWLWAVKTRRVAISGTDQVDWPPNGRLSEHLVFTKPDLPDEASFSRALDRAGAVFGVTQPGKALNARNVARFAAALRKLVDTAAKDVVAIPARLRDRRQELGATEDSHRLRTAVAVVALLGALRQRPDSALVEGLGAIDLTGTSAQALSRSFHSAAQVARALDGASWKLFGLVRDRLPDPRYAARARALLDRVGQLLVDDELNASLPAALPALEAEAHALLERDKPKGWAVAWRGARDDVPGPEALAALDALRAELAERLERGGEAKVRLQVEVLRREGEDG